MFGMFPRASRQFISSVEFFKTVQPLPKNISVIMTNDAFSAQFQGIRTWAGTHDRLAQLKMPVLVIHGETDRLVPPENGRIIARAIPDAELAMLPNASHMFFTDQPGLSKTAILSFLAR